MNPATLAPIQHPQPDKTAIRYMSDAAWQSMSFADFGHIVDETRDFLHKFGVGRRDRVFIVAENHAKWLPVFLAITSYGAIAVPVDARIPNTHLIDMLLEARPRLVFVSKTLEEKLTLAWSNVNFPCILANFYGDLLSARGDIRPTLRPPDPPQPSDPALIVYTSGTTDKPKGIIHTHASLRAALQLSRQLGPITADDVLLSILPFSHIFGLVNGGLFAYDLGCRQVLANSYEPVELIRILREQEVSYACLFPRLAEVLLEAMSALGIELPGLKLVIGGSGCAEQIIRGFRERGIPCGFGYGMTETCGGVCINFTGDARAVGQAPEGVRFRVEDSGDGIGELLIQTPTAFTGIYGRMEQFPGRFREGWLRSGDMARLDGDGQLFIYGRTDDVIHGAGGIRVYPDALEMKLGKLPFFREYSVTGLQEGEGQIPVLVGVMDEAYLRANGVEDAHRFIEDRVEALTTGWPAEEKFGRIVPLGEPLPRSFSLKVQRNILSEVVRFKLLCEAAGGSSAEEKRIGEVFAHLRPWIAAQIGQPEEELTLYRPLEFYHDLDQLGRLSLLAYFQHTFDLSVDDVAEEDFTTFYTFTRMLLRSNSPAVLLKVGVRDLGHKLPMPAALDMSEKSIVRRLNVIRDTTGLEMEVFRAQDFTASEELRGNIEYMIGYCQLPIGVIGPLTVHGDFADGEFYVPLATSEGALCASVGRGAKVITLSGGAEVKLLADSIARTPVFIFDSLGEMVRFGDWVREHLDAIREVAQSTTRHGKLLRIEQYSFATNLCLRFVYSTGEASGQNMTTISTHKAMHWLKEHFPGTIRHVFLECNMSGDKKVNALNFLTNRGKKAIARVTIPRRVVHNYLKTEPETMLAVYAASTLGGVQVGSMGSQAHFANPLTALYIACGQDAACAGESATGITAMEACGEDLTLSVTLPDIMVGTVGGGTKLPTQSACLALMGCRGENSAKKLAEIAAASCLAAEISLIGSMAADDFARAHAVFGRGKKREAGHGGGKN